MKMMAPCFTKKMESNIREDCCLLLSQNILHYDNEPDHGIGALHSGQFTFKFAVDWRGKCLHEASHNNCENISFSFNRNIFCARKTK